MTNTFKKLWLLHLKRLVIYGHKHGDRCLQCRRLGLRELPFKGYRPAGAEGRYRIRVNHVKYKACHYCASNAPGWVASDFRHMEDFVANWPSCIRQALERVHDSRCVAVYDADGLTGYYYDGGTAIWGFYSVKSRSNPQPVHRDDL